jgi:predicted metal-dependent enzyme (double-stranded beta helix superfamily)
MTQAVSTARRLATWDGRAMRRLSATASSPAFAAFARAADALVADPHAVAERLRALLAVDGWLAPADRAPGTETYRQHLLHVSPCRGLSVVALVWRPGQSTAIHDHVSWCVVGVYRGVEREERFELVESGGARRLRPAGTVFAPRGHVETLVPPDGDIHAVTAAGREIAISIHVYGADIEVLGSSIHRRYDDLEIVGAAAA